MKLHLFPSCENMFEKVTHEADVLVKADEENWMALAVRANPTVAIARLV